jgi:hypothetical protein
MVVFEVLCHQMIEVLQSNRDEVIQALLPQRLDPPLHVGVAERGANRQPLRFDAMVGRFGVKVASNFESLLRTMIVDFGSPAFSISPPRTPRRRRSSDRLVERSPESRSPGVS